MKRATNAPYVIGGTCIWPIGTLPRRDCGKRGLDNMLAEYRRTLGHPDFACRHIRELHEYVDVA
jgi:hypothetical protein